VRWTACEVDQSPIDTQRLRMLTRHCQLAFATLFALGCADSCPAGTVLSNGVCAEPDAGPECTSGRPVLRDGGCVECDDEHECPSATDFCSATFECVECRSDADCLLPGATVCTDGTCAACDADSCTDPSAPVCLPDGSACVGCFDDADCGIFRCVDGLNQCTQCRQNSDCTDPALPYCSISPLKVCAECQLDENCAGTPATPVCDNVLGSNECVECVRDGDCEDNPNGEVCDTVARVCVP
jgi:hypothetical protein